MSPMRVIVCASKWSKTAFLNISISFFMFTFAPANLNNDAIH